jgi:hypothetical protein
VEEDPANDPNNPNLYTYGRNNPLVFVDPTGLDTKNTDETDNLWDKVKDAVDGAVETGKKILSDTANYINENKEEVVNIISGTGEIVAGVLVKGGGTAVGTLIAVSSDGTLTSVGIGVAGASQAAGNTLAAHGAAKVAYNGAKLANNNNNPKGTRNPKVKEAVKRGQKAHKDYKPGEGYEKEVRTPSGKRADAVNYDKQHVKELKPNNPNAVKRGEKQVKGYEEEFQKEYGGKWTSEVETY